jgi:hypothetical protein
MSSRCHALLEDPLPPLRVCVELCFLRLGSDGIHGSVVDLLPTLRFTQDTCTFEFLVERILASSTMYDPEQVFQCCRTVST